MSMPRIRADVLTVSAALLSAVLLFGFGGCPPAETVDSLAPGPGPGDASPGTSPTSGASPSQSPPTGSAWSDNALGGDAPLVGDVTVQTEPGAPIEIVLRGTTSDGRPLSFAIVAAPPVGSLSAAEPVDPVSATVTFTPAPGFQGPVEFSYQASDGTHTSNVGTVVVLVLAPVYFELDIYEGTAPLTVVGHAFTMTGDPLPDATYVWDWGDLEEGGPVADFGQRTHTFVSPGTYLVELSILLAGLSLPISCTSAQLEKEVQVRQAVTPGAGVLAVTPAGGLSSAGMAGGPFTPSQVTYTLSNSGEAPLAWKAVALQGWLTVSETSGALGAGASTSVTVALNSNAENLAPGSHSDAVTFTNETTGLGNTTRAVALTVQQPATLAVSPATGLTSSGPEGGPFDPDSKVYTLTNTGAAALTWSVAASVDWLSLSPASGTLAPGDSAQLTVSVNGNAAALPQVLHEGSVTFANETNHAGDTTRSALLTVTNGPQMATSVSQYGITWTFDKPYQVGHFVNGDWWVVPDEPGGTVTVVTVDPAPTGSGESSRNGSMVDPVPGFTHGYDGRSSAYDAGDAESFPLILSADQSLVSTISRPEDADFSASTGHRGKISDAGILTCVESIPSATAFRPAYCGSPKLIYDAANMDLSGLPSLTSVAETPAVASYYDGSREANFSRVWLDHVIDYKNQHIHPSNHMPDYGRDIATEIGNALLLLCLDDNGDRTAMARYICQMGIDFYGMAQAGGYWPNNGGHNAGRKGPILVAGVLLHNSGMLGIGTSVRFQEDDQTFSVSQDDVDRLLRSEVSITVTSATSDTVTGTLNRELYAYALIGKGTVRVTSGDGTGQERVISSSTQSRGTTLNEGDSLTITVASAWDAQPSVGGTVAILGYEADDIGTAEWGIVHATSPDRDNPAWGADYRLLNGSAWSGFVLAARILGVRDEWGHAPLFDYMDRYMAITDDGGASPGSRSLSRFAENMWDAYGAAY